MYQKFFPIMDSFEYCPQNCSGRGECQFGKCFCEIPYDGGACGESNLRYTVAFGAFFYIICVTSVAQLILCMKKDQGGGSIRRAFQPTTQKLLYFFVITAAGSRALYFSVKDYISEPWRENLFLCYYPCLLSLFSLVICFWAEAFHLGLSGKPKFLTKSVIGFATFNALVYLLLFAQFVSTKMTASNEKLHLQEIFSCCFAFMMLMALLFFLIYGVELFCKVEGAFSMASRDKQVNLRQVTQSRLGLILQAGFQLAVTLSLLGDVLGKVIKQRMTLWDRNVLDITFRIFELAVALWFPCVLWNACSPDELWILNPKKLLKMRPTSTEKTRLRDSSKKNYGTAQCDRPGSPEVLCSFCYDDKASAGPLISPCSCKCVVHHNCLKQWVLKRQNLIDKKEDILRCNVCTTQYRTVMDTVNCTAGFGLWTGSQTVALIVMMIGSPIGAWIMWLKITNGIARLVVVAGIVLVESFLVRLLGMNMKTVAKSRGLSALRILDRNDKIRTDSVTSMRSQDTVSSAETCSSGSELVVEVHG